MKPFLPALLALLFLRLCPAPASAAPVGVRELAGLLATQDPRLRISAQAVRAAEAGYRSTIAAAYPQITASTSYALDYVPELFTPTPLPSGQTTLDQGTHIGTARLSLSQLLPTAGTFALSVEDSMTVLTASGTRVGDGELQGVDPRFSQAPKLSASVSQPLFVNGKVVDLSLFPATLRKAELGYLRAREDNRDLLNKSLTAAAQSLFGVVGLRKSADTTARALALADRRLELARRNLKLGLVSELDVWEMEISLGRQRESLQELRYNLAKSERQLAQSLGRQELDGVELDDTVPPLGLDLHRDEILRRALARHPGIRSGALDLEGAGLDKTIAGQQDAPTLTLSVGFQPRYAVTREDTSLAGSFSDLAADEASVSWTFGVGVTVPIYRGGRRPADARRTDALERIAADTLLLTKQQVSGDVDAWLLARSNLEAKVKLLETNAALLERRLQIERGLLALGKSTELDVEAREIDLEAKRNELWRSRADLYTATIALLALAGEDLQGIIEGTTP